MAITSTLLDVRPPSACIASFSSSSSSAFGPRSGLALPSAPKLFKASSIAARSSAQATDEHFSNISRHIACRLCAAMTALNLWSSIPLASAAVRLPPLSNDPNRCEKAFVGNTIGQANGVADKLLDLRFCDYTNDKTNLKGKTLSASLMSGAKFDGADMTEVTMSKAYAVGGSFKGANFTNAILDRVAFDGFIKNLFCSIMHAFHQRKKVFTFSFFFHLTIKLLKAMYGVFTRPICTSCFSLK